MKKTIIFILINFLVVQGITQVSTTLVMSATPPATLSEWGTRKDVLTYIINNQSGAGVSYIIKAEIKLTDGTVIGTTDLAKARVYNLTTSSLILNAIDVLPLEIFIFTGTYNSTIQRTGKLPSDNYQLCLQLVRPADFTPISELRCRNFYLASAQLPILMKPYNEEVLLGKAAMTAIIFRWTPVTPRPREPITYKIQVFEVLPDQSPVQALRSNQPILEKDILSATQFIWQPQLSFFPRENSNSEKLISDSANSKWKESNVNTLKFIWTIQSLDRDGNPVSQTDGNPEGRSEPVIFFINPNINNHGK